MAYPSSSIRKLSRVIEAVKHHIVLRVFSNPRYCSTAPRSSRFDMGSPRPAARTEPTIRPVRRRPARGRTFRTGAEALPYPAGVPGERSGPRGLSAHETRSGRLRLSGSEPTPSCSGRRYDVPMHAAARKDPLFHPRMVEGLPRGFTAGKRNGASAPNRQRPLIRPSCRPCGNGAPRTLHRGAQKG